MVIEPTGREVMAHADTIKTILHRRPHASEDIPRRAKVYYVIIVAVLIAAAISFIVIRGIMNSVDNSTAPIQQNTNTTNPGDTHDTGAPTNKTHTPSDRVTPSPAGGGGNTILNPEQI
jgi:cytoskeletal protein RodZ